MTKTHKISFRVKFSKSKGFDNFAVNWEKNKYDCDVIVNKTSVFSRKGINKRKNQFDSKDKTNDGSYLVD